MSLLVDDELVIGVVAGATDVDIVATRAVQHVVAAGAVQRIGLRVAREAVVAGVACAVERTGADDGQVLNVGSQRVRKDRVDLIDAAIGLLDHDVADMIDRVSIVAGATDHVVGICRTEDDVVAGRAVELDHCRARNRGRVPYVAGSKLDALDCAGRPD